jgi:hypothetical protein
MLRPLQRIGTDAGRDAYRPVGSSGSYPELQEDHNVPNPRPLLFAVSLIALAGALPALAEPAVPTATRVAVVDFSGADTDFGSALADRLSTALGQDETLTLLDGDTVREAITRLKLPSSGPADAHQVRRLCEVAGAGRLILGSYGEQEDQITLKASLFDGISGAAVPGTATTVVGSRAYLEGLTYRLAFRLIHPAAGTDGGGEPLSGVIIDARHLNVSRAMGPRILDEDGNVIYPVSVKNVPPMEVLQEQGMAAYASDETAAPRSGPRPDVFRATDVAGAPKGVDLVVSRDVAAQILAANERAGFLESWAVTILVRPPDAGPPSLFHFKNGDMLTGSVIGQKEGLYTVLTDLGQIRFSQDLVERVETKS